MLGAARLACILAAVFGRAGTTLVAVYGLTCELAAVFGRAGIMTDLDWDCSRSCKNQLRWLQENVVAAMKLITMMLTISLKMWIENNSPVEKSLDWHNAINLQGAGAGPGNKLVTALKSTPVLGRTRNMFVAVCS